MSGEDIMMERFENITLFGHPMLFTCLRCDRDTLPKGMYMYEIRYDDDGQGIPCEIAPWIMVNHWGTVISNKPVVLNEYTGTGKPYRMINEDDWNYEGTTANIEDYMEKYPPEKQKDEYER